MGERWILVVEFKTANWTFFYLCRKGVFQILIEKIMLFYRRGTQIVIVGRSVGVGRIVVVVVAVVVVVVVASLKLR